MTYNYSTTISNFPANSNIARAELDDLLESFQEEAWFLNPEDVDCRHSNLVWLTRCISRTLILDKSDWEEYMPQYMVS